MFKARAVKVSSIAEVKRAYKKVKLLHPGADHIMTAHSVANTADSHDDGEHNASLGCCNCCWQKMPPTLRSL